MQAAPFPMEIGCFLFLHLSLGLDLGKACVPPSLRTSALRLQSAGAYCLPRAILHQRQMGKSLLKVFLKQFFRGRSEHKPITEWG